MTAPIPARSRVLREAPVWRGDGFSYANLCAGAAPLGTVYSDGIGWRAGATNKGLGLLGEFPSRAAAMAAVEAAVLEPDDGWLPIETAPRDGTRVLVFERGAALGDVQIDWWADDEWLGDPTHWRPLHTPPEDKV